MIDLGDELPWSLIYFTIRAIVASKFHALPGVFGCQVVGPGSGGAGVQGFISSFNITATGSKGTKPVAQKLDFIFSSKKEFQTMAQGHQEKLFCQCGGRWSLPSP